jgi:hypothetical protein
VLARPFGALLLVPQSLLRCIFQFSADIHVGFVDLPVRSGLPPPPRLPSTAFVPLLVAQGPFAVAVRFPPPPVFIGKMAGKQAESRRSENGSENKSTGFSNVRGCLFKVLSVPPATRNWQTRWTENPLFC